MTMDSAFIEWIFMGFMALLKNERNGVEKLSSLLKIKSGYPIKWGLNDFGCLDNRLLIRQIGIIMFGMSLNAT